MTYEFSKKAGKLIAKRTEPAHEKTRGLFIHGNKTSYGSTGVFPDWELPLQAASSYDFFEYFDGNDGEYYRVQMKDILAGGDIEPEMLPVRHPAWPGKSKREIRRDKLAVRKRAVAKAIEQERARRKREEQERLRREQEAQWAGEVDGEIEDEFGSIDDEIAAALKEEFPE